MKQIRIIGLIAAVVLVWALALWGLRQVRDDRQYQMTHVFVGEQAYPMDAQELDLRGEKISEAHYRELQAALPQCRILWDVPFQGGTLPSDAKTVTVSSMTEADVAVLCEYFPALEEVDGSGCPDFTLLMDLREALPDCQVRYQVSLEGKAYPWDTEALSLQTGEGLDAQIGYLPNLKTVEIAKPALDGAKLRAMVKQYPNVTFRWEAEVLGNTYPSDQKELDFSGTPIEDLEALEGELSRLPELEKVILCDCGLDSETLAAYRERVRQDYKVVWSITVNTMKVRTDETTFMPSREGVFVNDTHLKELKYCEDLIVVDLGHKGVQDITWLYHMPHVQFLVLVDSDVNDLTPIGSLEELIYLELFKCPNIRDYTPLLQCKALQDVNLAFTNGDVKVLAQMTWLDSLWANCCNATPEEKALLRESLPDTLLELDHGWHMGNGWRDRPNYYVMRDLLGMPYYDWGSQRMNELTSHQNKKKD